MPTNATFLRAADRRLRPSGSTRAARAVRVLVRGGSAACLVAAVAAPAASAAALVPTSTAITVPGTSAYGSGLRVSPVITGSDGGTPTGHYRIFDGPADLGRVPVPYEVQPALAVGEHSLRVVYEGDSTYAGSESNVAVTTVTKASTYVEFVGQDNARVGQTVRLDVSVYVPAPYYGTAPRSGVLTLRRSGARWVGSGSTAR